MPKLFPETAKESETRFFELVLPGLQQLMYGPRDVEVVRVTYRIDESNRTVPTAIVAHNDRHEEVYRSRSVKPSMKTAASSC